MQCEENVYETDKDIQTHLSVTLRLKDLGVIHNFHPSTTEVLKAVKK